MFHDRRRILINQGAIMTIETTSTSASWSPSNVGNIGDTLVWEVSGGVTIPPITINDPTFDLSGNTGTAIITAKDVSFLTRFELSFQNISSIDTKEAVNLDSISLDFCQLPSIDISKNVLLDSVSFTFNNLTTLDTSQNVILRSLRVNNNGTLTSLDVSNNPLLKFLYAYSTSLTPTVIDNLLIDLDNHGLSNGIANIPLGRTSSSLTAYNSLIAKGWTITES